MTVARDAPLLEAMAGGPGSGYDATILPAASAGRHGAIRGHTLVAHRGYFYLLMRYRRQLYHSAM